MINKITSWIGHTIAWFNPIMAIIVVVIVALRYAFDMGSLFLQESVIYLHATIVMLGISYALQRRAHVRVDILYSRFDLKTRSFIDLVGHLIFLFPFCVSVLFFSWDYVLASWSIQEGSLEVGGIQAVYMLKTLILAMAFSLLLAGFSEALSCLRTIRGR